MMKKSILSLSAAVALSGLGFATVANAHIVAASDGGDEGEATQLVLNPAGTGHMLFAPYYSAQEGNATFVNIVNTDSVNGKAVKVRFRGAGNSDDVLDFTLFLSPGDVWSGMVSEGASGFAQIETQDTSCTVPSVLNQGPVPFSSLRLEGDFGPNDEKAATREGYLEILNMADVAPDTALFKSIKHVNGVPPCDADPNLLKPLVTSTEVVGEYTGLAAPTGGLFGGWAIVNLPQMGAYSGNMTAVAATDGDVEPNGVANEVAAAINFFPQRPDPLSGIVNAGDYTADPLLTNGNLTPLAFDLPDMSTPLLAADVGYPVNQVDALLDSLGKQAVQNEWVATTKGVLFGSDWVISQPTRRYYVAIDYETGDAVESPAFADSPYEGYAICKNGNGHQVGMNWTASLTDREEDSVTTSVDPEFSPGTVADPLMFCGEVAVLKFGTNSVLNASQTLQDANNFSTGLPMGEDGGAGWGSMQVKGAPVTGFAAIEFKTKAGTNFGQTYEHRWK